MAELVQLGTFITASERAAANRLKTLPEAWTVICNKEVVTPAGDTFEVDFVVIADHVIFVIDEKAWSGEIYGNENVWVLGNGEPRRSPLHKIGHVGRQLAGVLRGRVPYLHEHAQRSRFVLDMILLSADQCTLRVADPRIGTHVLRLHEVLEELPRIDSENSMLNLRLARQDIRTFLTDLRNRPKFPQKINAFTVLEVLPGGKSYWDFLAQHVSGGKRLLKLYELDPVEQPKQFIVREYNAARSAAFAGSSPQVDPYFFWNEDRYLAIPFHLPEGSPLRMRPDPAVLREPSYALELTEIAFKQLSVLHKEGLVHRRLDPESVYVKLIDGAPRVQFFNFMCAHIDNQQSIATELDELEKSNVYLSPECRIGFSLGGQESDVYGLALAICNHLSGLDPSEEEANSTVEEWVESCLRSCAASWSDHLLDGFASLMKECTSPEPRSRPTTTEVGNEIRKLREHYALHKVPASTQPQTLGGGQYRVLRVLGEGATAITYLVEDNLYGGEFVLKRIRNISAVQRYARTEFNALKGIFHPCLPRIFDVRQPQDDFHLKLEYIAGSELSHCMSQFFHRPSQILHLGTALLSALSYLEEHGISHRDIAPKNIIIPDEENGRICLIDFGLARLREDTRHSAVGTPLYRDPRVESRGWTNSSDLYSVAVVLYEALTGKLPFVYEDGIPKKHLKLPLSAEEEDVCGPALLRCLRRATDLGDGQRFGSASAFLETLKEAAIGQRVQESLEGRMIKLEWVHQLRGLYRNSATGNADNRGLDSDFAKSTYIRTLLDRKLLPDVVEGKRQLVLLTGNPGDGKTAFLEKVRDELKCQGAVSIREDRYGWILNLNSRTYEAIYDASESRENYSSEQTLFDAFSPFKGAIPPNSAKTPTLLVAINDGRLHEFFRKHKDEFAWLSGQIEHLIFDTGSIDDRLAVVDLKRRALVQLPGDSASLFTQMLETLVDKSRWMECAQCAARIDCPINFNSESLRQPEIVTQVEKLFLIQQWRRTRRATIRDVRSALSYFITGNLACEDVHAYRAAGKQNQEFPKRLYFHAAFNSQRENDEMLADLAAADPAQRANPRLDRFLHFHRNAEKWRDVFNYLKSFAGRPGLDHSISPELFDSDWHSAVKRAFYFESDDNALQKDKWELPAQSQLLPYLFFEDFNSALSGRISLEVVKERLLAGFSRSEGITRQAASGKLSVALARSAEQELTVIKQFSSDEFGCRILSHGSPYIESIPDSLELFHLSGEPRIEVTLDLFELLSRLSEGYTPETQEFEPFLIELREFKSRLLRRGVQEVLLLEGRSRRHRVTMENHVIELKEGL